MITVETQNFFTASSWKCEALLVPSFHDVDPMGVVWHGNYFRVFESVRESLFHALDYGYAEMNRTGFIWPVVDCKIKYIKPWLLEEPARVSAEIVEFENRLKMHYEIRAQKDEALLNKCDMTHMAFDLQRQTSSFVSPDIFLEKLRLAGARL